MSMHSHNRATLHQTILSTWGMQQHKDIVNVSLRCELCLRGVTAWRLPRCWTKRLVCSTACTLYPVQLANLPSASVVTKNHAARQALLNQASVVRCQQSLQGISTPPWQIWNESRMSQLARRAVDYHSVQAFLCHPTPRVCCILEHDHHLFF